MVYRTSLAPLVTLRQEMDRFFDDAFGKGTPRPASWYPAVDVREGADAWLFEVELPGVDPAQVEVTADRGVLTLRGEKASSRKEGEEGRWLALERMTGSFERRFRLPENVREEGIEASFAHGLLTLRVPKAEVPKPRRIEIKA